MGSYASYFGPFSVDAEEGVVVHGRAGSSRSRLASASMRPAPSSSATASSSCGPPVSTVDGREVRTSVFWNRLSALDPDAGQG